MASGPLSCRPSVHRAHVLDERRSGAGRTLLRVDERQIDVIDFDGASAQIKPPSGNDANACAGETMFG